MLRLPYRLDEFALEVLKSRLDILVKFCSSSVQVKDWKKLLVAGALLPAMQGVQEDVGRISLGHSSSADKKYQNVVARS